jgi:hypothetical protein
MASTGTEQLRQRQVQGAFEIRERAIQGRDAVRIILPAAVGVEEEGMITAVTTARHPGAVKKNPLPELPSAARQPRRRGSAAMGVQSSAVSCQDDGRASDSSGCR